MQNDMSIDGHNISTWYAAHMDCNKFTAANMTVAARKLHGYNLSKEEKTQQPALMAGYCRLLDEYGLIGYGDTEFEALKDLFSNATLIEA